MSSTSDPLKKQAEEAAADEPSSKKAKLDETKGADTNNGTTASDEKTNVENSNGSNAKTTNKTPNKSINGNDKEADQEYDGEGDGDEGANSNEIFSPKVAKCLEAVEHIQSEICNLNETASEEILKVEQKFNKLRRPHFEKRNELLKDIPNFWLTSLANHPIIAPMIESAEDEDCLHYMVNLDVEEFEDIKSGYKLKLHFVENPYITNEVIVKEFRLLSSDDVHSSIEPPIEYKNTEQGNRLKQVVENSIAQCRRAVSTRRPGPTQQSFFAWLAEHTDSGPDEVAEILKDQIWPNPLEFFFATPDEFGSNADDDESDDEDEEIDDEDIDDDEDGVITEGIDYDDDDEEIEGEEEDEDDDEGLE